MALNPRAVIINPKPAPPFQALPAQPSQAMIFRVPFPLINGRLNCCADSPQRRSRTASDALLSFSNHSVISDSAISCPKPLDKGFPQRPAFRCRFGSYLLKASHAKCNQTNETSAARRGYPPDTSQHHHVPGEGKTIDIDRQSTTVRL